MDFVDSHFGIACASNTVTDGHLTNVYVYQTNGNEVADVHFDPDICNASETNIITIPNPDYPGDDSYNAKIQAACIIQWEDRERRYH